MKVYGTRERPRVDWVYFMAICAIDFDITCLQMEMFSWWWCCRKGQGVIQNIRIHPLKSIHIHGEFMEIQPTVFSTSYHVPVLGKAKWWPETGVKQKAIRVMWTLKCWRDDCIQKTIQVCFLYFSPSSAVETQQSLTSLLAFGNK